MNKPMGYDEATAAEGGAVKRLPAGNYVCIIKNAKVQMSQSNKEMLVLALDIAEGEYKGYWNERFMRSRGFRADAKYPCVYRQLTEGNHVGYFKGMIAAIEESNRGYKWDWDESKLKDKKIGVMFGEEEFLGNDGEVRTSCKPMYVCSVKSLKDKPILEPKKLKGSAAQSASGFVDVGIEEISEDDLPF